MEERTKFCQACGKAVPADATDCPHCGRSLRCNCLYIHGREKSKTIALLLCLFTISGHKFYEGKIGIGLLYYCTLGLFGIGWIIDIITIASIKGDTYYVK